MSVSRRPPAASLRAASELVRAARWPEAERMLAELLRRDPRDAAALAAMARLHLQRGAPDAGLPFMERALRERPDLAEAHYLHASLLRASGRLAAAVGAYQAALGLKPDFAEARLDLGGLFARLRDHEAARGSLEAALRLRPDFPEARNNLGVALMALDQPLAALEQFREAFRLKPDFADAVGNAGSALMTLGRLAEAADLFAAAIALAPRDGRFYLDLVSCRQAAPGDPVIATMRALAAERGLAADSRIALHFALGRALADAGDTDASFGHFRQGNALQRVGLAYNEAATLALLERARTVFTGDLLRRRAGAGDASVEPVFVVGMPRSGTTLVEQILASHPRAFGAGESHVLPRLARGRLGAEADPSALFEAWAAAPDAALRDLGAQYAQAMTALAPEAARVVDKMPGNFLLCGLIALALPRAKIIHVRRDPVDTCVSCFRTLFGSDQPYAYNLAELGRYYRAYAALMAHWREALPEGMLLEVAYEDVVADLEGEARRMVGHCGLEWDARCLDFHATPRAVRSASRAQVRQTLYRSAVGSGRRLAPLLGPLLQALGPLV